MTAAVAHRAVIEGLQGNFAFVCLHAFAHRGGNAVVVGIEPFDFAEYSHLAVHELQKLVKRGDGVVRAFQAHCFKLRQCAAGDLLVHAADAFEVVVVENH